MASRYNNITLLYNVGTDPGNNNNNIIRVIRGRLKVATKGQIGGCASEEAGGGVPCSEFYGLIRRRFRKFPVPVRAWAEDSYI